MRPPSAYLGPSLRHLSGVAQPAAFECDEAVGLDPRALRRRERTAKCLLGWRDDAWLDNQEPRMRRTPICPLEALGLETCNDCGLFEVRKERSAAL